MCNLKFHQVRWSKGREQTIHKAHVEAQKAEEWDTRGTGVAPGKGPCHQQHKPQCDSEPTKMQGESQAHRLVLEAPVVHTEETTLFSWE